MTARRDVVQRLATLSEIHQILNGIRTTSMLEARKLGRLSQGQRRVVESMEEAASTLLSAHPMKMPGAEVDVLVALGSERGFCGDYNQELAEALEKEPERPLIAVGHRLHGRLRPGFQALAGPSVAEEVPSVLQQLAQAIPTGANLEVLLHDPDGSEPIKKRLLPPFEHRPEQRFSFGPRLNVSPQALLAQLIKHYLLASLEELFYRALLAENQRRLQHLQGATQHLQEKLDQLSLKLNMLRQEEITQEIEVIMLNYENLAS